MTAPEPAAPERQGCPSCDRDLSYPGAPGHECYTYAEHAARIRANEAKATAPDTQSLSAIESLLRTNARVMRERDDALDELTQERVGRQQAADELMRLKDHASHPPMTAPEPVVLTDGERVAEVLAAHRYRDVLGDYEIAPFYKHFGCSCGWEQNIAGMSGWWSWLAAHEAHVAEQIADRLAADRAAHEALRERVLAIHRLGPDGVCYGCWEAGGYDGAPNYPCETALAATAPTPPQDETYYRACAGCDSPCGCPLTTPQDAATEGGL